MDKELKQLAEKLKAKGYMIETESNDIDRVRPDITISVSGHYRTMGDEALYINPPGLNMSFFDKDRAEKFAEELRLEGWKNTWVHGWFSGRYTSQSMDSWEEGWIYDIEIGPKDKN